MYLDFLPESIFQQCADHGGQMSRNLEEDCGECEPEIWYDMK